MVCRINVLMMEYIHWCGKACLDDCVTINGACSTLTQSVCWLKPSAVPSKKEVGINRRKGTDNHVGGVNQGWRSQTLLNASTVPTMLAMIMQVSM